jgi:hypothetical protein
MTKQTGSELVVRNRDLSRDLDRIVRELQVEDWSGPIEQAIVLATAIELMREKLTEELMRPIKFLCGSKIGFRTDKDSTNESYSNDVIRDCFIESLMIGLRPTGNQWNIIAGNMYVTKEGCTKLLSDIDGLIYDVVCDIPKNIENKSGDVGALVEVTVTWKVGQNPKNEKLLKFACKGAKDRKGRVVTGPDAYMGKAERKAKNWLYNHLTGNNITEGDVSDSIDVQSEEVTNDSPPRLATMAKTADSGTSTPDSKGELLTLERESDGDVAVDELLSNEVSSKKSSKSSKVTDIDADFGTYLHSLGMMKARLALVDAGYMKSGGSILEISQDVKKGILSKKSGFEKLVQKVKI